MNDNLITRDGTTIAQYAERASLLDIRSDSRAFPRIKEYAPDILTKEITAQVLTVYRYRGQKPESAAEVGLTAQLLTAELLSNDFDPGTRELTMEEIRRALRRAALGQGAEMYGINVRSLYDAITDYMHDEVIPVQRKINSRAQEAARQQAGGMTIDAVIQRYAGMMTQNNDKK